VHAPQPAERLHIAKEVHDAWMLLERRRNNDEELPACAQSSQTRLDVAISWYRFAVAAGDATTRLARARSPNGLLH
jgi:hypothetical protein